MSAKNVLKLIKDKEIEFVDLRFTDPKGKLQHLTMDSYQQSLYLCETCGKHFPSQQKLKEENG